ncbi:Cytochrome oxidase assembly protein ShyY1 [Arthrobacter alpinus]|uniref:SURF1-like protein n=1 Tax=Arthrobacter alpinus TaxID=656366 RepID=A0A1H5NNU3_9MICC|nr:SURF1 family protein [Arthrobacter alpinus]SEF02477.1 Cytochrome oxidase assembly protein ShyY1 [Arthrobacter alpinus]
MLKTAVKPKWIAALVFALAVSAVLVLLSQWQFSRSLEKDVAPPSVTEKVQPLLDTLQPGHLMTGDIEGQMVTATGHFDPTKQVLVPSRLQDGNEGYWAVTGFVVDGAVPPVGSAATQEVVIPVARGWVASPGDVPAVPVGGVELEGRLLNSEGPVLKKDLPEGQVAALSSAELTNRWNVSMYASFIVSFSEIIDGQDVGADATSNALVPITVTATDQNNKINWLNIFYSIEWAVFAGFAVFLWWRLVADDYRRDQDALYDLEHDDDETP